MPVIRFVFKSGHTEQILFDKFNVVRSPVNGDVKGVTWKLAGAPHRPDVLHHIALSEIAAIIEITDRSQPPD